MKKFLSVLLALLMVVSTVSFAAPAVVNVDDSVTEAVTEASTEVTTDVESDFYAESDYGTLVFNIDFEKDGISFTKNTAVDVNKITDNYNSEICPSGIIFTPKDFVDDPQLVTDANGNTYLNCTNSTLASGYRFFQITENSNTFDWKDGTFTMVVDYYYTGGLNAIAFHVNGNTNYTKVSDVVYKNGTWQTAIAQYSNQLNNFYIAPGYAANYANNFGVDNIRLYYSADTVKVTVKADNATQTTANGVVNVSTSTGMTVSNIVANANMTDLLGLAETKDGAMLSADTVITPVYAKSYYGVFGFDVSVFNNGNSGVSNVTVSDIDTRKGITVEELVAKINNTSDKVLRGISETVDGQPLATSTKINTNKTLYMIWEADESEYGTLLFNIDFEQYAVGYEINETDNNNMVVETFDSDAITNGEFTMNWQLSDGGAVAAKADGNKYLRGKKKWAQFRINNSKYNAASAPMATGIYTVVADVIDFGTSGRTMNAVSQVSTNIPAVMVDTWSGKTNTWDKVVGRWQNIEYRDMTWYFIDDATTDVGFDNIKLYFEPVDETVFYVTVNANGKSGASNAVVEVDAGKAVTVADLKAAMPGCIGIAETATGDMLADNASILPKYNKTVYAVWGFDVTLNAGLNTEMSNVVVSGIDTRRGTTIGALIDEINNTTDRTLRGLSTAANYNVLPESTPVNSAATYYMIWELDEEELGTLILDIDFEKDGLTSALFNKNALVTDIATSYNNDLVKGNVNFILGQSSQVALANPVLVTENGNTYLKADTRTTGDLYNFIQINEWSNDVEWRNGTYTYVVDYKTDKTLTAYATHTNGSSADVTIVDGPLAHTVGGWDTIVLEYNGVFSKNDQGNGYLSGSMYYAPNVGSEAGILAVDNVRLYFKTDETTITLKPNGNNDLSDIEVPVSTSTGITVAELIEEVNKYSTTHKLLGIGEAATGDVLAEDVRITPDYQMTLYMHWASKANNPMVNDNLGKLLFAVDFERQEVIDANWNGNAELDNTTSFNSGEQIAKVATLYDTELFDGKDFRVRFLTNDRSRDNFDAKIMATADGENHFIQGVTGPSDNGTRWPQAITTNKPELTLGNGIYTVFIDAMGTGAGSFAPHTDMAGYNPKKINPVTYGEISAWTYTPNSWGTYAYSYEITDDSHIPQSGAYFSFNDYNQTVAFDNYKLYYKPFTATITVDPGDYPEFGTRTIENISTTGGNTAQDIVEALREDLEVCGRDFIWLVDEYGDVVDLNKELIIPGDVTYTIVWGDMNEYAPVTQERNAIRYSIKEESRGIRFVANLAYANAYNDKTTEYGWVIARKDVLEAYNIKPTSFTKESFGGDPKKVIVGKNYGYQNTDDDDADRKHFEEGDENIVITAVIYGVPAKYYRYAFTVRPYIVIDNVTYYGKPWSRSIYDTAVSIRDANYAACGGDQELINYIDTIIANTPAE